MQAQPKYIDDFLLGVIPEEEDKSISIDFRSEAINDEKIAAYITDIPNATCYLSKAFYKKISTETTSLPTSSSPPISFIKNKPTLNDDFILKQKWEGCVLEVKNETFFARLVDISNKSSDEEAEIYIDEISEDDRILLEPGAIFYWSIGYLDSRSGRIRSSVIRFRRLPAWNKKELDSAFSNAKNLYKLLIGE